MRYCFALDLKDDLTLIAEYESFHTPGGVWPEVPDSLKMAGVENMEIYRCANRLFMIMEVNEHFSFEKKAALDAANPKVQEWEKLMWNFQQPLPWAKEGEKWVAMKKIFELGGKAGSG